MLTGVTITGADDYVRPEAMLALSERYPFVEWGVLASPKPPRPRYPSPPWLKRVEGIADRARLSLHVCGGFARELMQGDSRVFASAERLGFRRAQVNGYVQGATEIIGIAAFTPMEVILQCRSEDALQDVDRDAAIIRARGGRASVLFDPSGGRGIEAFRWPATPLGASLGFAGGIGPENVRDVLGEIGPRDAPFWIDMESKVRTDDRLDLGKVEAVLEACAPFVRATPERAADHGDFGRA